jgi:cobalt-zinc-cadmium efflux system outer membrane protein
VNAVHRTCAPALLWLAAAVAPMAAPAAGLGFGEALEIARLNAPALRAQQATLAADTAAQPAAASLPDPRLSVGVENMPVTGPDRYSVTRDPDTMQRLGLMQEVPNRAKRDARVLMAGARIERDRALLAAAELAVRRDTAMAWLGVHFAERRQALISEFQRENRLLQDTLSARIASGAAAPAEMTAARQEALAIADRGDDLARDVKKARAELQRWVGARAGEPLAGEPALPPVDPTRLRDRLHHHADLKPYTATRDLASAEMAEASADERGDWSWEVVYSRRQRYDDMVSFQFSFDLPWQRDRRQQPVTAAKRHEIERIEAERDDLTRRHATELESMLAELTALDAQHERLAGAGLTLAAERVSLVSASYQSGRADLGAVLMARAQALETRMRAIDLEGQRAALRVRLASLMAEE